LFGQKEGFYWKIADNLGKRSVRGWLLGKMLEEARGKRQKAGFRFWGFGVLVQFPHYPTTPLPNS
jgi:hypothetical protein